MTDPSSIQRSVRRFLRLAPLAAVVATTACATPQEQTYETRLAEARTAPDLCQSDRFHVLVAKAWEKAHEAGGADVEDASPNPNTPAPAIQVQASSAMPDVSFPPYSQRACRMTVQSGTAAPETGFFTVAYFMHNGKVDTSVPLWDSDKEVSDYYNELKEKIRSGVDMNNPTLKACMQHYPALHPDSTDPAVQQAAISLRAVLVRHCLADHAALKNLYSDMYFIHR